MLVFFSINRLILNEITTFPVFLLRNSKYLVSCCTKSDNVLRYHSFGSIMPGREYTTQSVAGYRFGFNSQERDNEISGNGNSIAYEARILDSRLARWLSVDPLWQIYTSYSPYNFGACNPINNIDIAGKSIIPADEKTKTDLQTHFSHLFKPKEGDDKMTALLISKVGSVSYNEDGTHTVNYGGKISKIEFRKACKGLSPDQKAIARGYYIMINSDKKALVQIGNDGDAVNPLGGIKKVKNGNKNNAELYGSLGALMGATGGGATAIADGTVPDAEFDVAVFISKDTDFSKKSVDILDKDGNSQVYNPLTKSFETPTEIGSSFDEILAHETIGHGLLEGFLGRQGDVESTQISNIIRRMQNKSPRSGHDHGVNSRQNTPDTMKPKANVKAVPTDFKK